MSSSFLESRAFKGGVLLLVILAYVGSALSSPGPSHDEAISMMASNAASGTYARHSNGNLPPFGSIVKASEWQRFTSGHTVKSLAAIRNDLLGNDIHPPLGFWVLNLWLSLGPERTYRGAVLLMIGMVVVVGIAIGRTLFVMTGSTTRAFYGALLFLIGNASVITAMFVRHYALLTIVVVLLAYVCVRLAKCRKPDSWSGAWCFFVALICYLGTMTHYIFLVLAAPLLLATMAVKIRAGGPARVLACGLVWLGSTYAGADYGGLLARGTAVFEINGSPLLAAMNNASGLILRPPAIIPSSLLDGFGGCTFMALSVGLAVLAVRSWRQDNPGHFVVSAGACLSLVGILFLIVARKIPPWSVDPSHMAPWWGLACLSIFAARGIGSRRRAALAMVAAICVLCANQMAFYVWHSRSPLKVQAEAALGVSPDVVLITTKARGDVLSNTMRLPENQEVLVADPEQNIGEVSHLLRGKLKIVYLRVIRDRKDAEGHQRVLQAFKEQGWAEFMIPTRHPGSYDALVMVRSGRQL